MTAAASHAKRCERITRPEYRASRIPLMSRARLSSVLLSLVFVARSTALSGEASCRPKAAHGSTAINASAYCGSADACRSSHLKPATSSAILLSARTGSSSPIPALPQQLPLVEHGFPRLGVFRTAPDLPPQRPLVHPPLLI